MGKGLSRFLLSSLGRKFVMAVTGFLLVGFSIAHLAGNLTLYGDLEEGTTFIEYAEGIHSLGPLLYVAEIGLVLLFGVHVWMAFQLTKGNKSARPVAYAQSSPEATVASKTMFISGAVVLGFIIVHLINFRFAEGAAAPHADELYGYVKETLANPLFAAIYLIGSITLGFHLSHGFRSAFQSLGANHPRLNMIAGRIGLLLSILIGAGFASFPIVFLMIG